MAISIWFASGIGLFLHFAEFPGRHAVVLPENPVEAGVILESNLTAHFLQGNAVLDQILRRVT